MSPENRFILYINLTFWKIWHKIERRLLFKFGFILLRHFSFCVYMYMYIYDITPKSKFLILWSLIVLTLINFNILLFMFILSFKSIQIFSNWLYAFNSKWLFLFQCKGIISENLPILIQMINNKIVSNITNCFLIDTWLDRSLSVSFVWIGRNLY